MYWSENLPLFYEVLRWNFSQKQLCWSEIILCELPQFNYHYCWIELNPIRSTKYSARFPAFLIVTEFLLSSTGTHRHRRWRPIPIPTLNDPEESIVGFWVQDPSASFRWGGIVVIGQRLARKRPTISPLVCSLTYGAVCHTMHMVETGDSYM